MIELIREGAALVLAWCIGITVTYGMVESTFPPVMGFRIAASAEGPEGWWVERLLYCPFCMGFWCQGIALVCVEPSWFSFVRGACIGTAVMIVARAAFGSGLIDTARYEIEAAAREQMRDEEDRSTP